MNSQIDLVIDSVVNDKETSMFESVLRLFQCAVRTIKKSKYFFIQQLKAGTPFIRAVEQFTKPFSIQTNGFFAQVLEKGCFIR